MTRIETARVKEVLGLSIGSVQQAAQKLSATTELQQLEEDVADLEKAVADLRSELAGLPYKHSV